jgi:hypothetical protein
MKGFRFVFAVLLGSAALVGSALATDILTNRGNNARTGLNAHETILTPSIVRSPSFRLLYNNPVDGQVYAQPLYVSKQLIIVNGQSRGWHNVLYVATEHDSLYAFDADSGVQYWKASLLLSGESSVSSNDVNCSSAIQPEIGITATPVIDRSAGPNGTIFVVAMSKNATNVFYRIHAIDLSTGQDRLTPAIISGSVTGTGPATTFVAKQQINRAGLLLLNHIIYTCWASFCDNPPFAGWIIAYNENDFSSPVAVFNTDPNGPINETNDNLQGSGNGIWQSGNGPSVDANNNVYVATGNGQFDPLNSSGFPASGNYGDSVLKLTVTNGIEVSDYFTPFNQLASSAVDRDLASGGPMVLDIVDSSGFSWPLLYQAGKDGDVYLLNRNSLGKFNSTNQIYQELPDGVPNGVWSSPAYFNGSIYVGLGPEGGTGPLIQLQFDFTNPHLPLLKSTPVSSTTLQFNYPGATPTVSSNGTTNGIVWAYERNASHQAILHAYDATNLQIELFNSGVISGAVKFAVPTVCNGKVFVGTANSIAAFGTTVATFGATGVGKDFNNDGTADLVWENSVTGEHVYWFLKNGEPVSSSILLPKVARSWHVAGVGDFLGNGQSDLVWENIHGQHVIWIMASGVPQYAIDLPTLRGGWHVVGAGDFNSDGKADLVWENRVNGEHVIWLMNNGAPTTAIPLAKLALSWRIAAVGDFLGNGQSDLVWENKATGARTIWLMENTTLVSAIDLGTVGREWHIAGAGDFLGTGQADLIWQNTVNGQRVIWVLQNGHPTSAITLPHVAPQWKIVDH